MDWNQSKLGYYFDFALVPVLCIITTWMALHAPALAYLVGALLGFVIWTFAEYWIHRSIFHRVYRREHWLHHKRPGGYVAAPPWLTGFSHVLLMGALLGSFGLGWGAGLFVGLEFGYLTYIWMHDRIHHARHKGFGWLRRCWEHHNLHHGGAEVNFGVFTNFWDHVFGTYQDPRRTPKRT